MTGGSKNHLFVKIISNKEETIGDIQEEISESSDNPVKYSIIIEDYDQLYKGEQQLLSAILIFTFLNILLSVLGLIGLVTNDTEARTKEIAIKKVFGAENGEIMITLNLNLLKFFLPSIILGCLISWWIMWGWLQDYAYRRGLEIWLFILGVFIIFVVAVLSVSIQTWKAARQSPAVALQTQ
jgi:putative ABC transport system permease protein